MPELPEVETIRRSLLPTVKGRIVSQVVIDTPAVFALPDPTSIQGYCVSTIRRRGKYLLFYLTGQDTDPVWLIVHLRMTGRLTLQPEASPVKKHTHVRVELCSPGTPDSVWLIFQDTRRFGRLWLQPAADQYTWPECLAGLGPEPLDPPVTADSLAGQLERHKGLSVKAALLNQSVIAGIGNIYADEILFDAGLPPDLCVASLTEQNLAHLATAIPDVLNRAIELCGTTLRDYVDGWNQKGSFQTCLMVYGRAGLPCRVCGHEICKKKLAGRTTSWCPVCQLL
ncbi:MAG: bifunctional DNA-formamidopyrimidine glycosylase/DNA-(apurinic or apyrimidinic site) lyase [Bacillota bacterium]|nr:bifunctional DNA-formamidopyrimidine glycosylase/DNA-(apurinic or apyrimidinic site) lyase [Bacillota bacterium]